jgi:hypothetical protein
MFSTTTHWHKRIVRAGKNTLQPYNENPPDLTLGEDEILFLDFGPVFEAWEADFGRTFVLGNDPAKLKLRDDVGRAFHEGKKYFHATPGHHQQPTLRPRGVAGQRNMDGNSAAPSPATSSASSRTSGSPTTWSVSTSTRRATFSCAH